MAKRKTKRGAKKTKNRRKLATRRGAVKRPSVKRASSRRAPSRKKRPSPKAAPKAVRRKHARPATPTPERRAARAKAPRLDRVRRTLDESFPTPPSSLNMNRHPSAARTGRAGLTESLKQHAGMTPAITGGDVDVNIENAYFTGDEAPGGDNPTPDQDVVDDIGKALGVVYQDNEELKSSDKVVERDKHRWELDPASSEDYKERK